jgi:hypothetical protein
MKVLLLWKCFLLLAVLSGGSLRADTINWYSTANRTNHMSSGTVMDSGFQFQLGVFTGGFIPTATNIGQWSAFWVSAQSASYSETSKSYNSNHTFTGNAAPFTAGAKAYVWGRRIGTASDEWILFRKSDWNWPLATTPEGFTFWSAATANEVVLGSVNPGGSPFFMKSSAIVPYARWRDSQLAGEMLSAPNDDADHDGTPNLLEFIFGTSPTLPGPPTPTPTSFVDISGQRFLQISIPRLQNHLSMVSVEVSGDLVNWNSGTSYTTELSNTPEVIMVRDLLPSGPGLPRRFMRVRAVVQP